jgi:hypothetical protein
VRPGGVMSLTTPNVWPLHEEPRDFYRYPPHGLRHLLDASGFVDIEVLPLSGQWTTLALLSGYALRRSRAAQLGRVLSWGVSRCHAVAVRLDERSFQPWLSWNHVAVAWKR